MSKRYTLVGMALAASFIVAPAFADGTPGRAIVQGPTPLQPNTTYASPAPCQRDCIAPFAPQRHVYAPPPPAIYVPPAPQTLTLDLASFTGGVGSGVNGGYYGGGGAIVFNNQARFSGVLSHRASFFTFRQRKTGGGGHHGCGSCGGGMGGGD